MLSLCYFLQELKPKPFSTISWAAYSPLFHRHLGQWSKKCKNLVLDTQKTLSHIRLSDVIVYQQCKSTKSSYCNSEYLEKMKKRSCRLIQISSIYVDIPNFDSSIQDMVDRENTNNPTLRVSDLLKHFYGKKDTMLNKNHPNTFLLLEIVKELSVMLKVPFFKNPEYNRFLTKRNWMQLP